MNFMTFHSVGNVMIPIDEVIFIRGVGQPPISKRWLVDLRFPCWYPCFQHVHSFIADMSGNGLVLVLNGVEHPFIHSFGVHQGTCHTHRYIHIYNIYIYTCYICITHACFRTLKPTATISNIHWTTIWCSNALKSAVAKFALRTIRKRCASARERNFMNSGWAWHTSGKGE